MPSIQGLEGSPEMNSSQETGERKSHLPIYLLAFFFLIFRLFYITWNEVHPDEAYYWGLGDRLDWSYFDHPPLTSYLIGLSTYFTGKTEFGVRLPGVILSILSLLALYFFTFKLFDDCKIALLAATLFSLIPAGQINAVIITPDSPQFFFWGTTIIFFYLSIESNFKIKKWWICAGLSLGLALLSKYTAIFLVPSLLFYLSQKKFRKLWFEPGLWGSFLLGLLLFLPVLYWNVIHEFISFRFQIHHGFDHSPRPFYSTLLEFLGGQAGLISPVLFFLVIQSLYSLFSQRGEISGEEWDKLYFLGVFCGFSLLFFLQQSLRSKVEANWPGYCYFTAFPLMAYFIAKDWTRLRGRGVVLTGCVLSFLLSGTILLHGVYRVLPVPLKKDASYKLKGWKGLGEAIDHQTKLETFSSVVAEGPTLCSLIRFYSSRQKVNELKGKGHYFKWNREIKPGENILFVTQNPQGNLDLIPFFKLARELETYTVLSLDQRPIRTFYLFLGENFKPSQGTFIKTFPEFYHLSSPPEEK